MRVVSKFVILYVLLLMVGCSSLSSFAGRMPCVRESLPIQQTGLIIQIEVCIVGDTVHVREVSP